MNRAVEPIVQPIRSFAIGGLFPLRLGSRTGKTSPERCGGRLGLCRRRLRNMVMNLASGSRHPAADAQLRAFLLAWGTSGARGRGGGAESRELEEPPGQPERGSRASLATWTSDANAGPRGAGGVGCGAGGGRRRSLCLGARVCASKGLG